MRRVSALVGFFALLLAALVAFPSAVQARPVAAAGSHDCSTTGYPFSPAATVSSSATSVNVGEKIEVSGSDYCGNDGIAITIGDKSVGSATTNSDGAFDPEVTVPSASGKVQLCGTGATKVAGNSDCLTLTVSGATTTAVTSTGTTSGGGTAFTGVQIGLLIALAALLLGGGGAFVVVGRNRRSLASTER